MFKKIASACACVALFAMASVVRGEEGGTIVWWEAVDADWIETVDREGNPYDFDFSTVNAARIGARAGETGNWSYLDIYAYSGQSGLYEFAGKEVPHPGTYFSPVTDLTSYSFIIEIGSAIDGRWVKTELESEAVGYDYLDQIQAITEWIGTQPAYAQPWAPEYYTVVPEPSSGLLVLMGSAFLMLRRRTKQEK